jgi:predicted nucleic acid-binding Zn ribbon protein
MTRRQRKPKWSGRWEVQRERLRVPDWTPPPESRDAAPLAAILGDWMKRFGMQADHWAARIESEWTALVGADVARHTRPGRVEADVLIVYVDHPVWMSELKRYGSKQMLRNLREHYGTDTIRRIIFRIDPDG